MLVLARQSGREADTRGVENYWLLDRNGRHCDVHRVGHGPEAQPQTSVLRLRAVQVLVHAGERHSKSRSTTCACSTWLTTSSATSTATSSTISGSSVWSYYPTFRSRTYLVDVKCWALAPHASPGSGSTRTSIPMPPFLHCGQYYHHVRQQRDHHVSLRWPEGVTCVHLISRSRPQRRRTRISTYSDDDCATTPVDIEERMPLLITCVVRRVD